MWPQSPDALAEGMETADGRTHVAHVGAGCNGTVVRHTTQGGTKFVLKHTTKCTVRVRLALPDVPQAGAGPDTVVVGTAVEQWVGPKAPGEAASTPGIYVSGGVYDGARVRKADAVALAADACLDDVDILLSNACTLTVATDASGYERHCRHMAERARVLACMSTELADYGPAYAHGHATITATFRGPINIGMTVATELGARLNVVPGPMPVALNGPGLVPVALLHTRDRSDVAVVMPLCTCSLGQALEGGSVPMTLELRQMPALARAMGAAVCAAWSHGRVACDIKLENIGVLDGAYVMLDTDTLPLVEAVMAHGADDHAALQVTGLMQNPFALPVAQVILALVVAHNVAARDVAYTHHAHNRQDAGPTPDLAWVIGYLGPSFRDAVMALGPHTTEVEACDLLDKLVTACLALLTPGPAHRMSPPEATS